MRNKFIPGFFLALILLLLASSGAAWASPIQSGAGELPGAPLGGITAGDDFQPQSTGPQAPNTCSTPVTVNIRGKDVDFNQCYQRTFSHDGTNYEVDVYYLETDLAVNLNRCDASNPDDYPGRCEHAITNADDSNGDNLNAVAIGAEAETAMRFYDDRNIVFLGSGTTLSVYIAEDPRGGGTPTCNSIQVDDEWIDDTDVLKKRLLAFHEIQHLVQCWNQPTPGWDGFYGEGIARAIEDRVDTALDADTGHLFIPEMNGILGSDALRSSDLTSYSYPSALWWTWLLDRYTAGGEIEPVQGWPSLRTFYISNLGGASTTLAGLKNFITAQGSSFRKDFTDYTLAMYAYKYTTSAANPRLDFLDGQINTTADALNGHTIIGGGPAFSTSNVTMAPRSSRYWEFTPASQCDFIAFSFNGNGKPYSFSVLTVDSGGTLEDNWTSYSNTWYRTVGTSALSRVVGVVTAIDDSGTVAVGRGCVTPSLQIKNPTTAQFEMVGTADNPRNFILRLRVTGTDSGPVAGLTTGDFQVQLRKAGSVATINATILSSTYVQDDYWLLVQSPKTAEGAENGQFYDVIASLGSASDTEASAVLYVPRSQDVIVVLDRSGSMGGATGRIEAARNAGVMFVNELADTDQGGYVAFDTDATLRQSLDVVGSGAGSHRQALISSIQAEVPLDWTSIGDGMLKAAQDHDLNKDPANLCSFVLLSDGYENEPQFWDDVRADVVDNGCAIHAIALGPEANEVLMQQIAASVPGGSYDYADSSGDVPIHGPSPALEPSAVDADLGWSNNLSRIYDFKASQIAGRQRIQATLGTGRDQKQVEYFFYVDDASSKLVITLGWQNAVTFQPTIELFDPDGNPIVPTDVLAPTAGPSAVRRMMPTNQVWEVIDLIPGTYKLVVTNLFQEHFLSFSVESFYQMYLFAGAPIESLSQGVQVPILAALVAPDGPLTGADVNAAVRDPSGALRALHLFDDGNHGDGEAEDGVYGNLYSITSMADGSVSAPPAPGEEGPSVIGSYLVNAVATKGDLRREAQTSFAIQEGADEDGDRLPDAWEKLWGIDTPDGDADGDKLSNYCEYQGGTNPLNSDTDGGGESDGSESPQCYADPNGQDPFDPSDDRVKRPGGFHIRPWLTLDLTPVLRLWWPLPEVGDPFHFQLDRRPVGTDGTPGPWETLAPDLTAPTYEDGSLIVGDLYQYRLFTFVETISGTLETAVEDSAAAAALTDPFPPGGSVLINGDDDQTATTLVTLDISADDLYGEGEGVPPLPGGQAPVSAQQPHTPAADLMMRLSNSPDFSAAQWVPFQTTLQWDLGAVPRNTYATVYIQFMDAQGNISYSGFGQMDSILYAPTGGMLYLPMITK